MVHGLGDEMTPAVRRIVALIIACALAFGVVAFIDHLATNSVTFATGGHVSSGAELKTAMEAGQIPFNALLLVLGGWLVAAYIGSTVASRLSGEKGPAQIFTAIFFFSTAITLLSAPHPTWMWIGGILGVPAIALGAAGDSITLRTG